MLTIVDNALKTVIIRKLPNKRAETVVAAFRDIEANTFCKFIAKRHYFDNSQLCFFAAYQGIGCNHF
ncbi:hypothetical protein [Symbiopectobacterium purcellii]|uniref:hypothetical protein n=1 Tax=Symbiopectobacterium purcellii TaxID=2871826 RepID=UPI003F864D04